MKITKNQLIIGLVILIIIVGGYWFFTQSKTTTTTNIQPSTTPSSSFFPTTAIKNIVTTITNSITSTSSNEVSDEPFNSSDRKDDFDILKAHKLVNGPVGEYGFVNKTGSTTLFYFKPDSSLVNFFPEEATSTKVDLTLASSSVIHSPDGKQIITLKFMESGLVGELTNLKSKITTKVITSPLTDWIITWPELNTLNLQTKPSSNIDGFAYSFNLKNKQTTKILGPLKGLNSLISPDGKKIIYSTSQNGQIKTFIKSIGKESGDELGIKTLVDKCIWYNKQYVICTLPNNYPPANYPDTWYQGLTSFNDNVWLINTDKIESYLISISGKSLAPEPVDAINLKVSPDGKTLYFINKQDRSLWSFDLAHAF